MCSVGGAVSSVGCWRGRAAGVGAWQELAGEISGCWADGERAEAGIEEGPMCKQGN